MALSNEYAHSNHPAIKPLALLCISAVFSSLLCAATWLLCPPEWDFYDSFVAHLCSGIATRNQLTHFFIYGFYAISKPIIWLQTNFKQVPWMGLLITGCLLISNTLFTYLLLRRFMQVASASLKYSLLALLPLLAATQIYGYYRPSMTGTGLLMTGCAFLLSLELPFNGKRSWIFAIAIIAWCLLATCIRFETLGGGLIIALYGLCNLSPAYPGKDLVSLIKRCLLPGLPALALVLLITSGLQNEPFLKQTEVDLYIAADGNSADREIAAVTPEDSIKEVAIKRFFLNDETVLTPAYIHQLALTTISNKQKLAGHSDQFMQRLWRLASPTLLAHWPYAVLNTLLLLFALLLSLKASMRMLVYQLLFWLVIFSLAYLVKLEDRHYLYLVQLFTYGNVLLFFKITQGKNLLPLSAAGYLFAGFAVYNIHSHQPGVSQRLQHLHLAEQEINSLTAGKILLLDGESKDVFLGTPFTLRRFAPARDIVFYDMGQMPVITEYRQHLDTLCQCNSRNITEFYSYLLSHKNELCIISTEERVTFITTYLQLIHQKCLPIHKQIGDFEIEKIERNTGKLHYYTLTDSSWQQIR